MRLKGSVAKYGASEIIKSYQDVSLRVRTERQHLGKKNCKTK